MVGARDEENELTLTLTSPAHSMETGVTKGVEQTRILIFCVLCVDSCLLLCQMNGTCSEDDEKVDITHCLKRVCACSVAALCRA